MQERFEEARQALADMESGRRRPGRTYQGFIKALMRYSLPLVDRVVGALRSAMLAMAGRYATREGFMAFAVDGSRSEGPRTQANEEALGRSGRKKTGPQFWMTTLWHMGLGLPWAWKTGPGTDAERSHLRELLPALPAGALVVADAGFVGYQLLRDIVAGGRNFLIRVGGNVTLLQGLGYAQVEDGQRVYLWPQQAQRKKTPPLVLRLIVLWRHGKPIYLVTNLSEEAMSDRQAAVLYEMRWGVEVFYRSLKQTLGRRKMLSEAPVQGRLELEWTLVGLQVLGMLSVEQILGRGKDPLSWSVAASLRMVRRTMQDRAPCGRGRAGLPRALGGAIKDDYRRRGSKSARHWPHKKNDPPAGPPRIREATEAELKAASALQPAKEAA